MCQRFVRGDIYIYWCGCCQFILLHLLGLSSLLWLFIRPSFFRVQFICLSLPLSFEDFFQCYLWFLLFRWPLGHSWSLSGSWCWCRRLSFLGCWFFSLFHWWFFNRCDPLQVGSGSFFLWIKRQGNKGWSIPFQHVKHDLSILGSTASIRHLSTWIVKQMSSSYFFTMSPEIHTLWLIFLLKSSKYLFSISG